MFNFKTIKTTTTIFSLKKYLHINTIYKKFSLKGVFPLFKNSRPPLDKKNAQKKRRAVR